MRRPRLSHFGPDPRRSGSQAKADKSQNALQACKRHLSTFECAPGGAGSKPVIFPIKALLRRLNHGSCRTDFGSADAPGLDIDDDPELHVEQVVLPTNECHVSLGLGGTTALNATSGSIN
jgi:hypothetical protein